MFVKKKELIVGIIVSVLISPIVYSVISKSADRRERYGLRYRGYSRSSDMKQLGVALLMYSGDYSGYFPDSLWDISDGGYIAAGMVANPGDVNPDPEDMGIYHRYYYRGKGIRDDVPDATIRPLLIYPYQNGDHRGITLLFVDGHIESRWKDDHDGIMEMVGNQHWPQNNLGRRQ